jgi:hypothetical protein
VPSSDYPTQVDDIGAQGIIGLRSTAFDLQADQSVAGKIRLVRLYGDPSNLSVDGLKTYSLFTGVSVIGFTPCHRRTALRFQIMLNIIP